MPIRDHYWCSPELDFEFVIKMIFEKVRTEDFTEVINYFSNQV